MMHFLGTINERHGLALSSYQDLHRWSVDEGETFWRELFSFFPIHHSGDSGCICEDWGFDHYGWFPRVRLNFAKNLLAQGIPEARALRFIHERPNLNRSLTYRELREAVGQFQRPLGQYLGEGEVLALYMPNIPETVIATLGASSLGAITTTISCDFGPQALGQRLGVSKPTVLVAAVGYEYGGVYYDCCKTIEEICGRTPSLKKVILVDFLNARPDTSSIPMASSWEDFLDDNLGDPSFVDLSFNHPLYILYSSGTTGPPKAIVHSQGGTLLQHIKELGLHGDIGASKNLFYFTTCGWMMWHWSVSALFFGGTVTLYEGSPGYPSVRDFFALVEKEGINVFGTSPKFLTALQRTGKLNRNEGESLETILSTGAPLSPEIFDFVYGKIKEDIHLASISGGTDIISCFVLGNPLEGVRRGEIQGPGLGMDVDCFDSQGQSLLGKKGELVCKKSFPSRPLGFLDDPGGKKFRKAYFQRFPGVWHHGDFVEIGPEGGCRILGRSDATLNPGGVRMGTAEIYGPLEEIPFVADCLCVARGEDLFLFLKMQEGEILDGKKKEWVKKLLRQSLGPRFVPRYLLAVGDIPYTRNGKKMELAVTRVLEGQDGDPFLLSMANPECLEEYKAHGRVCEK